MASVTPAAGEMGFAPGLSGSATQQHSASCNPPVRAGQACVERIASVRIIRRHPHWRGVALRLAGGEDGAERFELALERAVQIREQAMKKYQRDNNKLRREAAKALELGGSCEGPPGVRGDDGEQAFYAAYFRDPDGNKLCAFRIGPA